MHFNASVKLPKIAHVLWYYSQVHLQISGNDPFLHTVQKEKLVDNLVNALFMLVNGLKFI